MFLNKETDYAIRIVSCLSQSDCRVGAAQIAKETGVTPRFTQKILHRLVSSGIAVSFMGARGGYSLRSDRPVSLLEVVETICGPIAVGRCQHEPNGCTRPGGECLCREVFADVSDYMKDRFSKVYF